MGRSQTNAPAVSEDVLAALNDLQHRLWNKRRDAAARLEKLNDPAAVDGLVTALDDENNYVRMAAIRALSKLGDERAVQPLISKLECEHPACITRYTAIWALGQIGAPAREAIPYLQPFLQSRMIFPDNSLSVRELAETAIALIEIDSEKQASAAEEQAAGDGGKKLTAEERKAKREAAMARKREQ